VDAQGIESGCVATLNALIAVAAPVHVSPLQDAVNGLTADVAARHGALMVISVGAVMVIVVIVLALCRWA
jgi:hypothetical protein